MDEYTLSRTGGGGGAFLGRLAPTVFGLKSAGKKRKKSYRKTPFFKKYLSKPLCILNAILRFGVLLWTGPGEIPRSGIPGCPILDLTR